MVSPIAGDKFLDNGSQCFSRQLQMGYSHPVSLLLDSKMTTPITADSTDKLDNSNFRGSSDRIK